MLAHQIPMALGAYLAAHNVSVGNQVGGLANGADVVQIAFKKSRFEEDVSKQ
jgi:hypothetical protein